MVSIRDMLGLGGVRPQPLEMPASASSRLTIKSEGGNVDDSGANSAGGIDAPLADLTRRRLTAFANALSGFAWPQGDSPLFASSRLVIQEPESRSQVSASLTLTPDTNNYYKYFSKGFRGSDTTTLDPGDYKFQVKLGNRTESHTITVENGWTNADVLNAVASAVNSGQIKLQAEVVRQTSPGQEIAGLSATGTILALGLNQAYDGSNLSLADTSGHLLMSLDLAAPAQATGPASLAEYDVTQATVSQATTYTSASFDPDAATTLTAGKYSLAYSIGGHTGTIDFSVSSGDTWGDVLSAVNFGANSQGDYLQSELVDVTRPTDISLPGRNLTMTGQAVRIQAADPKIGQTLTLSAAGSTQTSSGSALTILGLNVTAIPGHDGSLTINNQTRTRTPSLFDLDSGQVAIGVADDYSGYLPLNVVKAVDGLRQSMSDIVSTYNDLRKTILGNSSSFQAGFAEKFRDPYISRQSQANGLGLTEIGRDRLLFISDEAFFTAIGQNATSARDGLTGSSGLVPAWSGAVANVLDAGVSAFMIARRDQSNPLFSLTSKTGELDLEKPSRILSLSDTSTRTSAEFGLETRKGLFDFKG